MKKSIERAIKTYRITARVLRILCWAIVAIGCLIAAYGFLIEPHWLSVREVVVSDNLGVRIIHITDIHYKGEREYLERVVGVINGLEADYVCFTGDLIEEEEHLAEVIEILARINVPVIGIMGNHDDWSGVKAKEFTKLFEETGDYFLDEEMLCLNDIAFHAVEDDSPEPQLVEGKVNILLTHYPAYADGLKNKYDLILAGHTHGGQLRLPGKGALTLPWGSAEYDMGLFDTPGGPMYVNPGIGTFYMRFRFLCRPEITLIEL